MLYKHRAIELSVTPALDSGCRTPISQIGKASLGEFSEFFGSAWKLKSVPLITRLCRILLEQSREVLSLHSLTSSVRGVLIPPYRVFWKYWGNGWERLGTWRARHKVFFLFSCIPIRALNLDGKNERWGNQRSQGYVTSTRISEIQGFEPVISLDSRVIERV